MNNFSSISIAYASQTGTAENVAFTLYQILQTVLKHRIETSKTTLTIHNMSNIHHYNILPNQSLVIFIISTTGDGDIPASMNQYWKLLLRKSLDVSALQSTQIAIFGLGDSSYEKYNYAARKLNNRLKQLGARELIPLGLGDDQAKWGYMQTLNPWIEKLLQTLNTYGISDISSTKSLVLQDNSHLYYEIIKLNQELELEDISAYFQTPSGSKHCYTNSNNVPLIGVVKSNYRMTSQDWFQDVRNITLDVTGSFSNIRNERTNDLFQPGDVASIFPINNSSTVERAIKILQRSNQKFQLHDKLLIRPTSVNMHRSSRIHTSIQGSLNDILSRLINIQGIPLQTFFLDISRHATNLEERDKLLEIGCMEGIDLYYDYCLRERRSYIDVLEDFQSCVLTLSHFFAYIPLLIPRQYSIASYDDNKSNEFDICVGLVANKTRLGKTKFGLCSKYLTSLQVHDKVSLYITKGAISEQLALHPNVPLILVGPGTGIAPMRSILQSRLIKYPMIPCYILYGCRKRNDDCLYKETWDTIFEIDWSKNQSLYSHVNDNSIKLSIAFSREEYEKIYVTHRIIENGSLIWNILSNFPDTCIIISGSAKGMTASVRQAFRDLIVKHGSMDINESEKYIQNLVNSKRYIMETWS